MGPIYIPYGLQYIKWLDCTLVLRVLLYVREVTGSYSDKVLHLILSPLVLKLKLLALSEDHPAEDSD